MYQPDIPAYLDAIKQQYETLMAENKSLKQENLHLVEANGQYIRKIQYYMSLFNRQKHSAEEPPMLSPSRPAKCLKRGSDWFIDGDKLCTISMREKVIMPYKITNAVISRCGRYVAFGCNYRIFILLEGRLYFLNPATEKMEGYDGGAIERDFQEYKVCPMDFTPTSSHLYSSDGNGMIRIWNIGLGVQESSFKSSDPIGISIVDNLTFVIGRDKTLKVYDGKRQVVSLSSGEEFTGPMSVSSNGGFVYATVSKNKILVFDMKTESSYLTATNEERILAMAISSENMTLSVGGYSRTAGLYKIKSEKPSCRLQETIEQKGAVLALGFIGSHLLVGQQEGFMVWDLKQKRSMRVQINESNVIGVSVSEECFTTIDNNGVLRVWAYKFTE